MYCGEYLGNQHDPHLQMLLNQQKNPPDTTDPDERFHVVQAESTGSPSSTSVDQDAPSPSKSQTTPETQFAVILQDVEEDNIDIEVAHMGNDPVRAPILQGVQTHRALLALLRSSKIESKHLYTSWVPLKTGKHRNSKRGLAHEVETVWKLV
nr:hypothetical protein [Tanacetum cinerariifolium]